MRYNDRMSFDILDRDEDSIEGKASKLRINLSRSFPKFKVLKNESNAWRKRNEMIRAFSSDPWMTLGFEYPLTEAARNARHLFRGSLPTEGNHLPRVVCCIQNVPFCGLLRFRPASWSVILRDQSIARSKRPMPCTALFTIPTTPHRS